MIFLLFWGWSVFFEKILPIIVLKHNLQLSPVKFTYDKINEVTPTINR